MYCPEIERGVLADINSWTPPGFGPFESYEADHTVQGGEQLSLAGLDIEVVFTPGHSPGHVTYAIAAAASDREGCSRGRELGRRAQRTTGERALLSGDVLFAGSVGRTDLPGGDWNVLERSIGTLLRAFPAETAVYPGHMGTTTLGRERDTNPFLAELRVARGEAGGGRAGPSRRRAPWRTRQPAVEPRGADQSPTGHVRRATGAGGGARELGSERAQDPGGGRV